MIGVAVGDQKVPSIIGAAKAGLISGLLTDTRTAEAVLVLCVETVDVARGLTTALAAGFDTAATGLGATAGLETISAVFNFLIGIF